jgi:type IX secretion system PorP/SprF family membrane protein
MLDKLGVSHQTVNAMMSYAYHIDLTEDILLSLGLSGGLYNNHWDPKKNTFSEVEQSLLDEKSSRTAADFHTGLELNAYGINFGASVTHLLNSSPEKSYSGKPGREIYAYVRYRIAIDQRLDVAPGFMLRNGNRNNYLDFNVTGYYLKKYWVGFSIRPKNSFAVMLGGEYNIFRLGYAYDRSAGAVSNLAANTHEIMLSARFQKPKQGRKTTRFLD